MKVHVQRAWGSEGYVTTLEDVIERKVSSTDYDTRGVAEEAQEIAQNAGKLLGRLISTLVEKKVLEATDITGIINDYDIEKITLLPPQDV